jgi:hypothetical protein
MMMFSLEELLSLVAEPEGDEARTLVRDFRTLMHFNQVTASHLREVCDALDRWSRKAWLSREWNRSILCSKLRIKLIYVFIPNSLIEHWVDPERLPDNTALQQRNLPEEVDHDISCSCCSLPNQI